MDILCSYNEVSLMNIHHIYNGRQSVFLDFPINLSISNKMDQVINILKFRIICPLATKMNDMFFFVVACTVHATINGYKEKIRILLIFNCIKWYLFQ